MTVSLEYPYEPTERQQRAHATHVDELLYGGAAGGGKSRFARAQAVQFAFQVPGSATFIFRRTFPDLNRAGGMIPMLQLELAPLVNAGLASYNASEHKWKFINGSVIELGYLARDSDVGRYQGSEAQLMIFDEATQLTEFQYTYLLSRLRSAGKVKARMADLGLRPRAILTANPGGIGHAWVKARFIDPAPPETVWKPAASDTDPTPGTRCFIPAKVSDNSHIDDHYERQLQRLPEDQRRALLDGDWDVYSGQMFKAFRRSVHVIDPEEFGLQDVIDAPKAVGVDYGMSAPFCALWGALLPNGMVYVYREAYKAELTPEQQADLILDMESRDERRPEWSAPVVLDSACWARDPRQLQKQPQLIVGPDKDVPPEGSIAWAYYERFGKGLEKSVKDRLSSVALVQDRLEVRRDGFPRLLISSQCRNLIRTLPALPRDDRNPEQVDTHAEDHCVTGDSIVHTSDGPKRIDELVGTEGWCAGAHGWVRYFDVRKTATGADIVRVLLSDGSHIDCTPDHRVLTTEGWVEAGALSIGTTMHSATLWGWTPSSSPTPSSTTTASTTTSADATTSGKVCACTASFGKTPTQTKPSLQATAGTSTTPTTTAATTQPATCASCQDTTTSPTTASSPSAKPNELAYFATSRPFKRATPVSRVSSGQKQLSVAGRSPLSGSTAPAKSAALSPARLGPVERSGSAARLAQLQLAGADSAPLSSLTSSPSSAISVEASSRHRHVSQTGSGSVGSSAGLPLTVVGVESRPVADVYDLAVDDPSHAFAVNGGVVVHNCYDALSYLLQHFAHRYGEALTREDRIRRGRGEVRSKFGGVVSQTGGVAGAAAVGDW